MLLFQDPLSRQVSFQARLPNTLIGMGDGDQIIFDDVMLNDGHHYDAKTGNFTVPIKGVYAFFFTCTRSDSSAYFHHGINKNGQKIVVSMPPYLVGKPQTSVATAVIECEAGDIISAVVWRHLDGTMKMLHGPYSTFCGVLIYMN